MIELIPAIDIIDGKCVRLTQGDYRQKKIYNENPLEVAKQFQDVGIRRLHVVDLDGAKTNHVVNYKTLEQITAKTDLVVDFGGGLKSDKDIEIAFECGAEMVTAGSIAVKDPHLVYKWLATYGTEKIILGADVKDKKIAVSGWTKTTDTELIEYLKKYLEKGITKMICTDISKDGMLKGPAFGLYDEIITLFPSLYLIASGGISNMNDIDKLARNGIPAVIFGKSIYEGTISLKDLETFNRKWQ